MEGETLEGTPKPSGTLHATAVECIHRTDTTVYRAKAVLMEGADPIHVILKTNILHPEREEGLLDEARVYATDAKLLQGHAIPYFYGAFQGEVAEDPMTCLVFEDCGKPLGIFFHQIDGELALEIMQRVLIFHDIGLRHNDLTEENIVINSEGRTFLIDLEYTEPHACKRKDDVLVGSKQPQKHEFGCSEVWEIARLMGLWTKSQCQPTRPSL
ncbi:hypothetical protein PLICRDRAFT_150616 [Plicaturopsis crispa FD-325 SS-3]|nr:hypothetical protein PLICRDRAFT_150616 [Plicaturopsis crispa FD-325 SS-3]